MTIPGANFTDAERRWVKSIGENADMLTRGYTERIEYIEPVRYHTQECQDAWELSEGVLVRGKCECPIVNETRIRPIRREGLLRQLEEYAKNRDCNLNPQAARGAPRVKKAKLNPELNGFLTLDEITCDIYSSMDRIFEEAGRDRTYLVMPVDSIIAGLPHQARYIIEDGHPELAERILKLTEKWIAMARQTLNHSVVDTMFEGVVCDSCGGALASPARIEGETAAVRCIGSPSTPACGRTYPATEWLALYEGRTR